MNDFHRQQWSIQVSDGYSISCHHWQPSTTPALCRIMILHGIQSHAGWYAHLAENLVQHGIEVLMPDRRGSGANPIDRGHAASTHRLIDDLSEINVAWNLRSDNPQLPFLGGISWGGKLAAIAVSKLPETFAGLALIAPGLFASVRPPVITQFKIAVSALLCPKKRFDIPLADASLFTSQPHWQTFIETDPVTLHQATARFFIVSRILDLRLRRIKKSLSLPILLQTAGADRIVNNKKIITYISSLPSLEKSLIDYPGAHHTLEFEPEPVVTQYAIDLKNWLLRHTGKS